MKKIICTALLSGMLTVQAAALPEMGALYAKSAALYAANGQELYVYNADEQLQPASVTKIMTMLLAMEALERGEVTLDTMITGSEYACSMGGTQIWLEPGEQLTLERMNTRARELGCTNTTFINANGLDGEGQKTLTSARDLALISCELLRYPKILEYTGIWMDTVRGGKFGLANTNKMLKSYQGLTGLKTGYIREAGFCISASAERDGLSLVAVVMAADDLAPIPVTLGTAETVQPVLEGSDSFVIEKTRAGDMQTAFDLPETFAAPIQAGQRLGEMTVSAGGETVLTVPIIAKAGVDALGLPELLISFVRGLAGNVVKDEK